MVKHILSLLVLFFGLGSANAQVRVFSLVTQTESIEQLWELELNTNLQNPKIQLELVLEKKGKVVYRAKTPVFQLIQGFVSMKYADFAPIQILFNEFVPDTTIAKYVCKISVLNVATNQIIGKLKRDIDLKPNFSFLEIRPQNQKIAGLTKPDKTQKLGIDADFMVQQFPELEGFSNYNQQVMRGNILIKNKILNVPIEADLGYSNETIGLGQPGFKFGVNVDQAALKQEIRRQVMKRMADMKCHPDSLKQMVLEKGYPEYNKMKKKLGDLNYDSIRGQMDNLSDYKQISRSKIFKKSLEQLDSLKKEYKVDSLKGLLDRKDISTEVKNKIINLEATQEGYTQIQQKIASLEKQLKPYQKYRSLYEKMRAYEHADLNTLLSDKNVLAKMNELTGGKSNKLMGLLMSIKDIRLGSSSPLFSQQTLGGGRVDGLDLSWIGKNQWYFRAVVGQFRGEYIGFRDSTRIGTPLPIYLAAVKMGLGDVEDNHLHFSYLSFRKQGKPNEVSREMQPYENDVCGVDVLLSTPDKKLTIGAEANLSLYNPDKYLQTIEQAASNWTDKLLVLNKRQGFKSDLAFKGNLHWRINGEKTKMTGYFDKVGEGYKSVGSPFLLSNVMRWEMRLHQSLLRDKLMVEAYYRKDFDNYSTLSQDSSYYSVLQDYGFTVLFSLPKLPNIVFNIAPFKQTGYGDSLRSQQTQGLMYQLSANHEWTLKNFRMGSQLGLIYQQLEGSNYAGSLSQTTLTGSQNMNYKNVSASMGYNYSPSQYINGEQKGETWLADFSGGISIQNVPIRIGYQYYNLFGERSRKSFYSTLVFSPFKGVALNCTVQRNEYFIQSLAKGDWTGHIKIMITK
jgi:hypothetical protein